MTALARAAIRRLRGGAVPHWELDSLSVGYTASAQTLRTAVEDLRLTGKVEPLFVRGEWGSGKTHLLAYAQSVAAASGTPSARVDLNARSTPLSHPQRCYLPIVESIHAACGMGLKAILLALARSRAGREQLRAFARTQSVGDISASLQALCELAEAGDDFALLDDFRWSLLMGADLSWADYTYKREQALARIGALGRMFAASGMGGLVVVLDEAETIDQLANIRSRMSAYGVLGRLCRLKSVWCLFGITERFDRVVRADIERGAIDYQFATEHAAWFLRRWHQADFRCLEPPVFDLRNAKGLASKVSELYGSAYPDAIMNSTGLEQTVQEWASNPGRNPRRLIRLVVHRLDMERRLGK